MGEGEGEESEAWGGGGALFQHLLYLAVRRCSDVRHSLQGEALDDLPSKDERGPSSVSCTLELFQRLHWGKTSEKRGGAHVDFSKRIENHRELNSFSSLRPATAISHRCITYNYSYVPTETNVSGVL